jgi:hypothetical protein
MMTHSTLRPGLLVSLKTSIRGNVSYRKQTIEQEHLTEAGAQLARWETERTIADPVEHEAAQKVRSKVRSIISGVCANSAFGMLCPETEAENLEKAIAEGRKLAEAFNSEAKLTRVSVYIMTGRIAPDDVEAVRAINSEVRDLLSDMAEGLQKLDVKTVREAANRAKSLGSMLSDQAQARIQIAIDAARKVAREIVKAGEQAAQEIDTAAIRKITEQRTAFLDLAEGREIAAVDAGPARAIDLASFELGDGPGGFNLSLPGATTPAIEME